MAMRFRHLERTSKEAVGVYRSAQNDICKIFRIRCNAFDLTSWVGTMTLWSTLFFLFLKQKPSEGSSKKWHNLSFGVTN